MPPRETNHTLGFSDQKSDPCDRQSGVDHPLEAEIPHLALLSQFVSADTMETMAKRKEAMTLDWHIQFRGVYTRIAEQLKVDPFQWTEFSRTQVQGQVLTTLLQGTSVPASLT